MVEQVGARAPCEDLLREDASGAGARPGERSARDERLERMRLRPLEAGGRRQERELELRKLRRHPVEPLRERRRVAGDAGVPSGDQPDEADARHAATSP
jgi:hypothetical protein